MRKAREEEERLRAMTSKEKEELKKIGTRLSGSFISIHQKFSDLLAGRQLFERNRNLAHEDDSLMEEGTVNVDVSQYDRSTKAETEDEDLVHFSDSD